jgi:hypothetical protein
MSTDHGPRTWDLEKTAIDDAYSENIKKIFDVYVIGMEGADADALHKFKLRLHDLYRSRILAMSVLSDRD